MTLTTLLATDFTKLTPQNLDQFRRLWSKRLGTTPKNSHILAAYTHLLKEGAIGPNAQLENSLRTRKVRSMSGVTPFAVITKPFTCPGQCTFCPLEVNMPKSYLSDEPAGQRAQKVNFDPYLQVKSRLEQLEATGHHTDKLELIVIGGTFSAYPDSYKRQFFLEMYNAVNDLKSKTLAEAQNFNETAKRRIVSLSIETRPDWITAAEIRLLRELGVTKLQIGVQALDGKILKRVKRGHSIRPIAIATRMLKDSGFKICYHFMPNLPGSNPEKDVEMAKLMYIDPRFKPDFVKIYPTQVIPKTPLYREWLAGKFVTYNDKTLKTVLKQIKLVTPPWCRIDRLVRDISKKWVAGGTKATNMRQVIQNELLREGKRCQCIRCREIKHSPFEAKPLFIKRLIKTVGGQELFLSFEKGDKLYSLLRLRLPLRKKHLIFPELNRAALIREIHTFGTVTRLDRRDKEKTQHQGLGKRLLNRAEAMAKRTGYKKVAVISAIGTRNYYRKLGYQLEGLYMTKSL